MILSRIFTRRAKLKQLVADLIESANGHTKASLTACGDMTVAQSHRSIGMVLRAVAFKLDKLL